MATLTIEIEIPNWSVAEIKNEPDWFEDNKIVVDEAYLERASDDSFYLFELVNMRD